MPDKPDPKEFRRYRQALLVIYFAVGGLGILLVGASIVSELWLKRRDLFKSHKDADVPSPAELLACNQDVRDLLEALGTEVSRIQADAVAGDATDLGGEWAGFEKEWQKKWEEVNVRCKFDELADTWLGTPYDRMAYAHRRLPTLRLKYREMLSEFDKHLAREISDTREALDLSRADLEKLRK